jgi:FKBP-type peptidyl-prolyl cis-trans isomerase
MGAIECYVRYPLSIFTVLTYKLNQRMKKLQTRLPFLHLYICVSFLGIFVSQTGLSQKTVTPSGSVYTIHKAGSGAKGTIGDAALFDVVLFSDDSLLYSSIKEGKPMNSKIEDPKAMQDPFSKLIQEALVIMKAGDSASFTFRLDTVAVKPQGFENAKQAKLVISMYKIKPKAEVDKQDIELKALGEAMQAAKPVFLAREKAVEDSTSAIAKNYAEGQLPKKIISLPSGLKILILKEGDGPLPKKGEMALVNYCGALKTGKVFDNSYKRGEPINFPIGGGQLIEGWEEGVLNMKIGSIAILLIPSKLGYGDKAQGEDLIPANSDLVFYIELLHSVNLD